MFTTACETTGGLPPPEISRVTPPAPTKIPRGSVPCTQSPTGWCLSDEENGQLLIDLDAGERTRDRMICWLRVYFKYPPCPT
jgi:hypothetical protein